MDDGLAHKRFLETVKVGDTVKHRFSKTLWCGYACAKVTRLNYLTDGREDTRYANLKVEEQDTNAFYLNDLIFYKVDPIEKRFLFLM